MLIMRKFSYHKLKPIILYTCVGATITLFNYQVQAAGTVLSSDGQDVFLTAGEHYHFDGQPHPLATRYDPEYRKVKYHTTLYAGGEDSRVIGYGDNDDTERITITSETSYTGGNNYTGTITGRLVYAENGGKVILSNADLSIMDFVDSGHAVATYGALAATGAGSLVDISNSTIESYNRAVWIDNGATGKFSYTTFNLDMFGLTANASGSSLLIDNSTIYGGYRPTGTNRDYSGAGNLDISDGAYLRITDSNLYAEGTVRLTGINLSGCFYLSCLGSGNGISIGVIDNVHIKKDITSPYYISSGMTNIGVSVLGEAQALMNNVRMDISSIKPWHLVYDNVYYLIGLHIRNAPDLSIFTGDSPQNSYINVTGDHALGIYMRSSGELLVENSLIATNGNTSRAINLHHLNFNQGTTLANYFTDRTKITVVNSTIEANGDESYGVFAESAGSQAYLDLINLTVTGDNTIGLFAKEVESVIHASNLVGRVIGQNAIGMKVSDGADGRLTNSLLYVEGASGTGLMFNSSTGAANNMDIISSTIEAQDGQAIRSEGGDLDLTLTGSIVIGRNAGQYGTAIIIADSDSLPSGLATITASDRTSLYGDVILESTDAGSGLDLTLNTESSLTGRILNAGHVAIDGTSEWNVTGDSTMSSLINSGSITLSSPVNSSGFKTITVDGNYTGGGSLLINTTLAGDDSDTDRIIVTGNTSGETALFVNNVNGGGQVTSNGIEVISVDGISDGIFNLSNRAVAGAYEYFLHQDEGNWYLRSELSPEPPTINPEPGPEPEPGLTPDPTPSDKQPIYRSEVGAYLNNIAAANRMFSLRLEDREGRAENSSMWLRQVASRNKSRDSSDQLRMKSNSYVIQGGGEVWQSQFSHNDRIGVGVMAAYGRTTGKTNSVKSQYYANSDIDGYSVGSYATWYQNAVTLNGLYLDGWLQYSWFDASVNGEQLDRESYNIDGLSASLEGGYRMPVYQGESGDVFITPQAQVVWSNIKADHHREANGTNVRSSDNDNIQTRLGVKISRDGVSDQDKSRNRLFTVYAEANWLNNTQQVGVIMDGVKIKQAGSRNIGELKVGAEGKMNTSLNVWANVAQQVGNDSYSDTSVVLGVKYSF